MKFFAWCRIAVMFLTRGTLAVVLIYTWFQANMILAYLIEPARTNSHEPGLIAGVFMWAQFILGALGAYLIWDSWPDVKKWFAKLHNKEMSTMTEAKKRNELHEQRRVPGPPSPPRPERRREVG